MISLLKRTRRARLLLVLLSALFATGCQSIFSPATPQAAAISDLTIAVFIIAAIIFVLVEGALIVFAIYFGRAKTEGPEFTEGTASRLEIAWTAVPAIVLAILFLISILILRFLVSAPMQEAGAKETSTALNVRVIGHQWWWEFQYPDMKIVTANEMHVPVGRHINISTETADVIHSFWVPELGGKIDVVPGQTNRTGFTVDQTGEFTGRCSEFCGQQHANMLLKVIAEPQDQFDTWVKGQQAAPAAASGQAAEGETIFMTGACMGCHAVNGTMAMGGLGPNLTHFASRGTFAGSSLENTPETVAQWLTNPQALKPGNSMPNLHLTQDQVRTLAAYLENLR